MKAISIEVNAAEQEKIESFIKSINTNEEMAACSTGKTTICVAAVGEYGIAYAEAIAAKIFDNEINVTVIK